MEINETLHGFRLLERRRIEELDAELCRMTYEKNGADLIWLKRDDDNKTFAIAFKTIPRDDTGVFHILEHSVLCGSEKYPVKEPFVELLKSSLQTFLNAMTYPDKTMYPVCSRNPQDFLNLIDVYMDAVLHPLSLTDPTAFLQEGWHYELDAPDGDLRCNGVVYNEMKGAFATPDDVLQTEINRLLFPDSCYGFESGGDPDHIPELTYESYLENHRRFYHPSNARIFLDGDLDLDAVLEKLDGYLAPYERIEVDAEIPVQPPVAPAEKRCFYEIGEEEDADSKLLLAEAWVYGDYRDQEKTLAGSVLAQVLCGSNDAPLKKALIENDLCEDVELALLDGIMQPYILFIARNTSEEKRERVWQTFHDTVARLAEEGVDRSRLRAVLNRLEFNAREKDFGSIPRGLAYGMTAMETWLYGGDPAQNLCVEALFGRLRAKMEEGYFETFLRETLLGGAHRARLVMVPSKTLGEERREKEQRRLRALREGWTAAHAEETLAAFRALRERQETPDTPKQLATLPRLTLRDVPETVRETPQERREIEGVTLLHQPLRTNGIAYLELYFSLADLTPDELPAATFLGRLLGQVATEHYDVSALRSEIEGNLGFFGAGTTACAQWNDPAGPVTPSMSVGVSLLESRKDDAVRLIREVLRGSLFSDTAYIGHLLRQSRLDMEQSIVFSGSAYARSRVAAGYSAIGAVWDRLSGLSFLRWLQDADRRFEKEGEALCASFAALARRIFSKARLTAALTGEADDAWIAAVIGTLSEERPGPAVRYEKEPVSREGYRIPADVSFTAKGANLADAGSGYSGISLLAAQMLTFGYLWNTIRVQGGAYGTGLNIRPHGGAAFSSYRDPSAGVSLERFDGAPQALREAAENEPLEPYIISTIGALDPLLTPRQEGHRAVDKALIGQTAEDRLRLRHELLNATPADLLRFADVLDQVCSGAGVCVIGGAEALSRCALDRVEPLTS